VKRPSAALKLAAVASSALLIAGFVCYRAGAFDWPGRPASPAVEPASAPGESPPDATAQQPADPLVTDAMLSGSKSAIFVVPPGQTAGSPPAGGGSTVVLPGSKSIAPVIPPSPPAQPAAPPK
jgi:hypothetical protein